MTREEIFDNLNEVFRDVFDDETITVSENTTSNDIEDWDSLEHINLIVAVESGGHKMGQRGGAGLERLVLCRQGP